MTDTKVTFTEALVIKVGRFLRKKYPTIDLANIFGNPKYELTEKEPAIGLIKADSAPQLNRWQKIFRQPRRRFMGVLWLSHESKSVTHDKWLLEMYGDQDIEFLTEIAEKLCQEFNVSIRLELISEEPRYEKISNSNYLS